MLTDYSLDGNSLLTVPECIERQCVCLWEACAILVTSDIKMRLVLSSNDCLTTAPLALAFLTWAFTATNAP